jgi:hypothetical protein
VAEAVAEAVVVMADPQSAVALVEVDQAELLLE